MNCQSILNLIRFFLFSLPICFHHIDDCMLKQTNNSDHLWFLDDDDHDHHNFNNSKGQKKILKIKIEQIWIELNNCYIFKQWYHISRIFTSIFFLDPYFSLPYDTSYRFFGHQFNVVDDDDDDLRFFFDIMKMTRIVNSDLL